MAKASNVVCCAGTRSDALSRYPFRECVNKVMAAYKDSRPRDALIIPELVPVLRKYIEWHDRFLEDNHRECRYLFLSFNEIQRLSSNTIRQQRRYAEEDLGLTYDERKCRRSYGQYLKNSGVDSECISSLMGHNNTETTEDYYARISPDMALQQTSAALRKIRN